FLAWMDGLIQATRVSSAVVVLALFFVHQRKLSDPAVQGRPGSECITFTVALILAQKCLEGYSYPKETWAIMSGISARDINRTEVDFVSKTRHSGNFTEVEFLAW
ncbi:hypothetical protein BZA77DRAFT_219711, partial [Pyronema omphalodes]